MKGLQRVVEGPWGRVVIRRPRSPEEYMALVEVQRRVWGLKDYYLALPHHLMKAVDDHGGLVLGAFLDDKEPIGVIFGLLGLHDGKLVHYSHIAGVVGEHRFKGLGLQMKLAQREYVIKQGLDLVVWTYDPCQGANARFNIGKLGAVVRRFYKDYYGRLDDEINRGMSTDRFKAEWWVKSRRVELRLSGRLPSPSLDELVDRGAVVVTRTRPIAPGIRELEAYEVNVDEPVIVAEIPGELAALRTYPDTLMRWRMGLREVFEAYLSRGYVVVDFISLREGGGRRNFYVLWKAPLERILRGELP